MNQDLMLEELDKHKKKYNNMTMSIGEIICLITDEEMITTKPCKYSLNKKVKFIESLFLGKVHTPLNIISDNSGKWKVINGNSKIWTIFDFITDDFKLNNMNELKSFNDCEWSSLPMIIRLNFKRVKLSLNIEHDRG